MRQLTKRQKDLLRKWYLEMEPSEGERIVFGKTNPLRGWEDLSMGQIETLEKINDTEILSQNVNRFLWDLRFEGVRA